jgi:hypothetical protein
MRQWLLRGANQRSYEPARALVAPAVEHTRPLEWLLRQCDLVRPWVNREPNKQVVRGLWRIGEEKTWRCYEPVRLAWRFRRDLGLKIAEDRQIVEDGRAYAFWIQARTGYTAPTMQQLGMLGRIFLMAAKEAGYDQLGLYIADMRRIEGDARHVDFLSLDDLPLASESEAQDTLQLFANAYDTLLREGFDPAAIKKKRRDEREAAKRRESRDDLFPDH